MGGSLAAALSARRNDLAKPIVIRGIARRVSSIDMAASTQSAQVGQSVIVYTLVRDQFGSAMAGQTVEFRVVQGQGNVNPSTAQTNTSGQARTELTASGASLVRVRAQADGISNSIEVQFTQS